MFHVSCYGLRTLTIGFQENLFSFHLECRRKRMMYTESSSTMRIELSDHANEQNRRRSIPLNDIFETVKNPDEVKPSFRNRTIYRKTFDNRMLEMITVSENGIIVIVTQYYLDL